MNITAPAAVTSVLNTQYRSHLRVNFCLFRMPKKSAFQERISSGLQQLLMLRLGGTH